jgi:O-antigen/teichoic acid export membrane protein
MTELALVAVAIFKNKYLALSIGPEGYGVLGMLTSFFGLIGVFAGTWLATGTTIYISKYKASGDIESLNSISSISITFTIILSFLFSIILIVFRTSIHEHFLSEEILKSYYVLFSVAFIGTNLRPVLISILQGLQEIKKVVISRMIIAFAELASVLILVFLFDMLGLVMSITIVSIFSSILLLKVVGDIPLNTIRLFKVKDKIAQQLFRFGRVNLFLALSGLIAVYLQRKIILVNLGIENVGYFQVAMAMMGYVGLVLRGSGFYYLPKMSEEHSTSVRDKLYNDFFLFSIIVSIPVCMVVLLVGSEGIELLFSHKFLEVSKILGLLIIALYLNDTMGKTFGLPILGKEKLIFHGIITIGIHLCWILIPLIFITDYGLISLGWGILIASVISSLARVVYSIKHFGISISRRNIRLFSLGLIFLIISYYTNTNSISVRVILFGFATFVSYTHLSREETQQVRSHLMRAVKRIGTK